MWTGALFALNALLNLGLALALAWALPAPEYGAFSVYFATALLVGNLSYDWVRFSAMRFYTPHARATQPGLRATLDLALLASTGLAALIVGGVALSGTLPETRLATLVALLAITAANAAFEYWTALCRARFDARRYAVMVAARNIGVFAVGVPVAAVTGSFEAAMWAFAAAIVPSILYGVVRLRDQNAQLALASRPYAGQFARYAAPLVLTEGCYLLIAVVNRAVLADRASLAAAGAYALTFDLAFRTLAVTASVGDAVLFPRLVANLHAQGASHTRAQIARNIAVMLLVLMPAAAGYALVAGSVAPLALAEHFREPFARFAPVAVAAAFAYTAQTYVLRPAFQVALRTADIILAGVLAVLVDVAVLAVVPQSDLLAASCAHLAAMSVGLALVLQRAVAADLVAWPWRDIGKITLSTIVMAGCVALVHIEGRALLSLVTQSACGLGVYGAMAWLLNPAGIRALLRRPKEAKATAPVTPG